MFAQDQKISIYFATLPMQLIVDAHKKKIVLTARDVMLQILEIIWKKCSN